MKKQLLALSLLAIPGLFAHESHHSPTPKKSPSKLRAISKPGLFTPVSNPSSKRKKSPPPAQESVESCSECNSCCESTCETSNSRCECYTPQYYNPDCCWSMSLSGDFLYWFGRETNLSYAQKFKMVQTDPNDPNDASAFPQEYKDLGVEWEPGLRLGLGFQGACDGWDMNLTWTYYKNTTSDSSSITSPSTGPVIEPNQESLLNPWQNNAFYGTPAADKISAKWKLSFNQIDLDFGRKYWLSQCFAMRPYAAVRAAWTKTDFDIDSCTGPKVFVVAPVTISDYFEEMQDLFENRYWGVGLLAGIQPHWHLNRCFGIYGNIDASLVWGKFSSEKREIYFIKGNVDSVPTTITDVDNKAQRDLYRMLAQLDLGVGLRWEGDFCCSEHSLVLDIGWEHHILFNHGLRQKGQGQYILFPDIDTILRYTKGYDEVQSDIHMGGLIVRLKLGF